MAQNLGDPSKYFDFYKLTNKFSKEIQHRASREMAMIVNYMMGPPKGEPIWSFYSRATQLDFMKGFLKPLAVESGESSQEKPPEVYSKTLPFYRMFAILV